MLSLCYSYIEFAAGTAAVCVANRRLRRVDRRGRYRGTGTFNCNNVRADGTDGRTGRRYDVQSLGGGYGWGREREGCAVG